MLIDSMLVITQLLVIVVVDYTHVVVLRGM
jgi:hypothetical protein